MRFDKNDAIMRIAINTPIKSLIEPLNLRVGVFFEGLKGAGPGKVTLHP